MRKLFLVACLIIIANQVYAQKITYGVNAGLNITELLTSAPPISSADSYLAGFHAGGFIDVKYNSFSIQPGIFFTTKGGMLTYNYVYGSIGQNVNESGKFKSVLYYIEVPINVLYHTKVAKGDFYVGAGPYVGIGISGNETDDDNTNGHISHEKLKVTFGNGGYKNPDLGINGLVGYRLKSGYAVSAGFGRSILNLTDYQVHKYNQVFNVSLGYFF